MAGQDEKQFDNLQRQLKGLNKDTGAFKAAFDQANKSGKGMSDLLEAMEGQVNKLTKGATSFNDELRDSLDLARAIADSMEKQHGGIQRAKKAMNGIISIGQQIVDEERELDALSERRLQQLNKEARIKLKNFQLEAQKLLGKSSIEDKLQANAEQIARIEERQAITRTKGGQQLLKRLQDEQEIISGYKEQEHSYKKIVDLTRERFKLEKEVSKSFGLTGVALSAASTIASKMGMGHISDQLDDIDNKLRNEIRDAIEMNDGKALGFGQRFQFAAKGAMLTGKAIGKGMLDPLYLMGKIYSAFLDVNKESVELSRLSGQNGDAMAGANFALATSVDFLKVAGELTKRMGLNAQNVFSANVMAGAAELKNTMGLSAEEAGGLAVMAQTGGKDIKDMSTSMVSVVSSFNKSNRSAVSQGVALREAANASDSIKLSLGNSPELLAKAAAGATRLGLSLQEVDNIASSLTDFQSSISNELEAELLIGKDLNLEKARELALNNDIAGLNDELFKNSADMAEFGKMNRIQQEAYAKALGMTKDQLAKVAYNKALELGMSEEQAEAAAGVEASDMRRMAVQEKMALVMDKIFQAFAPILDIAEAILDPIAKTLAVVGGIVGYITQFLAKMHLITPLVLIMTAAFAGKAIASFFGTAVKGSMELFNSMKNLTAGSILNKIKALGSGLSEAFSAAKGGGAEEMVKSKTGKLFSKDSPQGKMITNLSGKVQDKAQDLVGDKAGSVVDKASEAGKKVPEKTGGGMSSLTDTIQKIKPAQLLAGGAALIMVAASVYIFAKAAQEFATVSWEDMAKAGVGLLGLVGALALVGAIMMSGVGALAIMSGAAAIVIMAGGLYILGKALQEVGVGMGLMEPALALVSSIGDKAMGLATVGASLLGIAAGLREIADAGTGAIPVLDKLNTLGGAGSKSVGEAKGKGEEGSLAAVEAKLAELITAVKAGGNVYMDSNKVGKASVLGTYKS